MSRVVRRDVLTAPPVRRTPPPQPLPTIAQCLTGARAPSDPQRYNLVLRGDSPSSRRLYDGVAAGALTVLVSDETWAVGLPFQCLVPWRR